MRLDKWYLDFQSNAKFRYYYVSVLTAGSVHLISAEIHHDGQSVTLMERPTVITTHTIRSPSVSLTLHHDATELEIKSPALKVSGTWTYSAPKPPRPGKPLFRNTLGWCDWKIWSPQAIVHVSSCPGTDEGEEGTGYVDLVRFAFPFWKIPFQALCWGRLFSDTDWIVVQFLLRQDGSSGSIFTSGRMQSGADVVVREDPAGAVTSFEWNAPGYALVAQTVRSISEGPILSRARMGRMFPRSFLAWLGSGGYEQKYFVEAAMNGKTFSGPMERIVWNHE